MEDELRDLLRRQADHVPPHGQVPRGMLRRARRRVVFTVATGTVVMAAIAFGGYTSVQALTSSTAPRPGNTGTPSGKPSPTGLLACAARDLSVTADLQGAAGHRQGSLVFTNRSAAPCTLEGRPRIQFLDARSRQLPVHIVFTEAWWQVSGGPAPSGWPVVTLQPGQKALVRTSWSNWCGREQPHTWALELPGPAGRELMLTPPEAPPCLGPAQPSTLEVGPFEPTI